MNKTAEYLDKCKEKLVLSSTYKLSEHIEISQGRLSEYYSGKHTPDDYVCFKIAEVLELDPAYVIASIKAESEKNEKKKNYFKTFSSASRKVAASIVLALVLNIFSQIELQLGNVRTAIAVFLKRFKFA